MPKVGDLVKTNVPEGFYKLRLAKFDTETPTKNGDDLLTLVWEDDETSIPVYDRIVHAVEQNGYPTLRMKWAPLYIALGGDPNFDVDPEDAQPFFDLVVGMVKEADFVWAFLTVKTYNGKTSNEVGQYLTQDAAEETAATTEGNPFNG